MGLVRSKSTQTLIADLVDGIMEDTKDGENLALLSLDQSKAYDLDHQILIEKFKVLGFNANALKLLRSYMTDRKQYVELQGHRSDNLVLGPRSVTQGSVLSCTFYLVFILDILTILHDQRHNPAQQRSCTRENLRTFVDDNLINIRQNMNTTMEQAIHNTMNKVEQYMSSNKLQVNADKTKVVIFSKDNTMKQEFSIQFKDKTIRHSPQIKILGNLISGQFIMGESCREDSLAKSQNQDQIIEDDHKVLGPEVQENICQFTI